MIRLSLAAGLALAIAAGPALAANESAYTDLNLDECTVIEANDFGASWACPGYKGWPLWVAEGDIRFYVSFGFGAPEEQAAGQTVPPFNYLGETIEWRLNDDAGRWMPFATIVRYFTQREGSETGGQVLVVTRIEQGATCHVAYIDARANSDANELARKAADEIAPGFDCAEDPEIIGEFSAW